MLTDPRTWAWGCRGLTPAQRLTLFALGDHADTEQGTCRMSLSELAQQTELSRRGVIKALGELDGRFIERERGGPGRRTRYRLRWQDDVAMLPARAINDSVSSPSSCQTQEPIQTNADETDHLQRSRPVPITPSPAGRALSTSTGEQPAPVSHPVPIDIGNRMPELSAPNTSPAPEAFSAPVHPVPQTEAFSAPTSAPSAPALVHSVPANNTNNQISNKKDSSLLLQPKRAKTSKQATPIASDWQPGQRAYAWAEKQGLTRDWVQAQIDEFVIYWSDAGERRKSWDATFINRLKWLSTHQTTHSSRDSADETIQHTGLADKDYASGATPPEQISWLRAYADA